MTAAASPVGGLRLGDDVRVGGFKVGVIRDIEVVQGEGATAELLERPDILRSVFIAGATSGKTSEPAAAAKPRVIEVDAPVGAERRADGRPCTTGNRNRRTIPEVDRE